MTELDKFKNKFKNILGIVSPYISTKDGNTVHTKVCGITKKPYVVSITTEEYLRWKGGEHIQNVCPSLTLNQREFLISGTTPNEWDDMYKEETNYR